jgi:ATP-dependent DNA ligase
LDGEFLAGKNLYDFLRARARARANGGDGDDLWLYIFDILYLDGVDLRDKPLAERKRILAETINVNVNGRVRLAEPRLCHVKTEIEEEFRRAVESGEEGVVVKPTGSLYRSGVWLKLKRRQTLDAVIVAAKKSPRFLRDGVPHSFLIGFAPDFKPCSGVGSGLNSEERTAVASLIPILKTREDREHIHLKPFLVVEIAYEDKLKDGGLRSPRILRLRTDKSPEECLSPLSFLLDNIV